MHGWHDRLESALMRATDRITGGDCPPRLAAAIRYAIFPPGNRLRPQLCYGVADALGDTDPAMTDAAAVALEFLHGASLIQDDLPAFDGADERRGRPALHRAFGESLAVLAADALIIGAFETLGAAAQRNAERAAALTAAVARGVNAAHGAVAGQAWEDESSIDLTRYHRAKTAALFEASTAAGAIAAGHDPAPWQLVGTLLGQAYQVADDLADEGQTEHEGSDAALGRPNALRELGESASLALLEDHIRAAFEAIPAAPRADRFREFLHTLVARFRPVARVTAARDGRRRVAAVA